jgi:LAO/AO transport system kinase
MPEDTHLPEWAPPDADDKFASRVLRGVMRGAVGTTGNAPPRSRGILPAEEYVQGVRNGDRAILARAITLVESSAPAHFEVAQEVLRQLLPHTGNSIRVGITGVPGAGKSTFIEALGMYLVERGHRVAVLAIDPTSSLSRGSILGDKTRMEKLSNHPAAFIRPSPTGGMLGGVARKTRETMLVCEAAGYDVVLVETVGTGQSEITVRSMVDFFLLLLITGAGDELQGIKKGVIEIADALLINKADGDNKIRAKAAKTEYNRALHYLTSATEGWRPQAHTCSALTGDGIDTIWSVIQHFKDVTTESGVFASRRKEQVREWLHAMIEEQLHWYFFNHPAIQAALPDTEQQVISGAVPAAAAARALLTLVEQHTQDNE